MTSTKIVLYNSKTLKNGENPILIRLTKNRKLKYISTGYSAKPNLWNDEEKEVKKGYRDFKQINFFIHKKKSTLDKIILEFENNDRAYTLDDLESKFISSVKSTTVFKYCEDYVARLIKTNKIGNANVYKDLLRTLKLFRGNQDLQFTDLKFALIQKYEEDFLTRGVSENSISVYMRTLRALFNKAIREGFAKQEDYPFNIYKISKLNTKTQKRAISKEDMIKIIGYEALPNTSEWHARNYFLFSFYCIGMNFIDMAKLRWSNLENGRLKYIRSKNGNHIHFAINNKIQGILKDYSKGNENSKDYIFPILNDKIHKNAQSISDRVKKVLKSVNKKIKDISVSVEVKNPNTISFYAARHTWATLAKKNGTPISIISSGLSHDTEKTTQIYLDEFDNDVVDEANDQII